jgi:hypothetical protein
MVELRVKINSLDIKDHKVLIENKIEIPKSQIGKIKVIDEDLCYFEITERIFHKEMLAPKFDELKGVLEYKYSEIKKQQ